MKKPILVALLSAVALVANAAPAEFKEADADKDGALSTEEARQALPEIIIVDTNNDGMLNQSEVETALPEVVFSGDSKVKEGKYIGATEYKMIVQVLARHEERDS